MNKLAVVRGIVKVVALIVGLIGTMICLMATVGLAVQSAWVRLPVALVAAIVVPAVISDRLLPDEPDKDKAKGLTGDVFALTWLGFTVVFAVAAGGLTRKMLTVEGDRLSAAGLESVAAAAYLLAGVDAQTPTQPLPLATSASTATSAAASASAVTSAASAAPTATASASVAPTASASVAPDKEPPDEKEGELTPAAIFKKYAPAVVSISVKGRRGSGGGTGFLLDDRGTIATNHHVIDGATEGSVKFIKGSIFEEVWVLIEDPQADLALLRVDLSSPTDGDPVDVEPVKLGDSDKIEVGERAISIGNPLGLEHTLTTGVVSSRRTYRGKQWVQMSTPISPGNSGGPVFNIRGEVIGVSTAVIGGGFGGIAQNLNLAVPINVLKSMIKADYPSKRKFGKSGGASHW